MYSKSDGIPATEVSPLIQSAVLSLRAPIDFKIVSLLMQEGSMPFSELRGRLKLKPTTLDRCLKRLMDGALLNNFYAKKEESETYSFYEVTPLGQELFVSLINLGRPNSALPVAPNPFYQPGPQILDDIHKMSELIERLRQKVELPRSVKE